jgi:outer membrane protein assembly factor BamB
VLAGGAASAGFGSSATADTGAAPTVAAAKKANVRRARISAKTGSYTGGGRGRRSRVVLYRRAFTKNAFSQPAKTGVVMLPGANGGSEWSPPAYSPKTHYVHVLGMDQLMTSRPDGHEGRVAAGQRVTNFAPHGVQEGRFVAIDSETGKAAWTMMTDQPLMGGALATAGNLVFFGEGNGDFNALNAQTGEKLRHYNLGAGVNAPPVTYDGLRRMGGRFRATLNHDRACDFATNIARVAL